MADNETKSGISVEEYREFALAQLAYRINGMIPELSDGYRRRLRVTESPERGLLLHVEGARPLRELDRLIELTLSAQEATVSYELPLVPAVPVTEPEREVVKVAPEGFELVSAAQMAQYRAELAQAQQLLGEEKATHKADVAAVQSKALAEMQAYRQSIDAEYALQKRKDAEATAARSRTALVAKIAEHFAPLLANFEYNFKDARHIGELVDFIVYDGLEEGYIKHVVFLEVKTRKSGTRVTNPRERLLKEAIDAGRVRYDVYIPPVDEAKIDRD